MDMDVNLPTSISQEDLEMLRTWVMENPNITDEFFYSEDSQASHVSDAEVLFGTLTTIIARSPRCDNVNSHESVRLTRESSIMGRRGTVSVYNAGNIKLGNLGQPLDEPMTTILDDRVARVDAVTLDMSSSCDQEVPLQLTLYGTPANRLRCQDILREADVEFDRNTDPASDRSIEIDLTRSPDMSFDRSPDTTFDTPSDVPFYRSTELTFPRLPQTFDSSPHASSDITPRPFLSSIPVPVLDNCLPGTSGHTLPGSVIEDLPEPSIGMLNPTVIDSLAEIDFSSSTERALDRLADINFGTEDQTEPVDLTTHEDQTADTTLEQIASWYTNFEPNPHIAVDSHREMIAHEDINSDIDRVFENLNEGDKTSEQEPAEAVGTHLYPHQKQALSWMMSRENGDHLPPFCVEKANGAYLNTLLNFSTPERPPSIRGGILADDMGLGKTLETIALILTNFVNNRPLAVPVPGRPRHGKGNQIPSEVSHEDTNSAPESKVKVENNNDETFKRLQKVDTNSDLESKVKVKTNNEMLERPQKVDEIVTKMEAGEDLPSSKTTDPLISTYEAQSSTDKAKCALGKLRLPKADSSNIETAVNDPEAQSVKQHVFDTEKIKSNSPLTSSSSEQRKKVILIDFQEQPYKRKRRSSSTFPSKYEQSKWRKLHLDRWTIDKESHRHSNPQDSVTCDSDRKSNDDVAMDDGSDDSGTCMQDITDDVSEVNSEDVDTDLKYPVSNTDTQNTCEEGPVTLISDDDNDDDDDELPDVASKEDEDEMAGEEKRDVCDTDSDMKDFMTANHCDERGRTLSSDSDPRCTLIICPLSVMSNWQGQIEEHAHPNVHIDVHLYYGNQRCKDVDLLKQKDVVITTYGILLSEFKEYLTKGASPLMTTEWLRVVLDEGHCIRNPKAKQTKAVLTLQSQRKWVLTGTPIQNRMLDMWPLINFLNVTPLNEKHWWQSLVEKPLQRGKTIAFRRVQHLMGNIAMRRTKNTLVDGEPLVKLPKREVYMERIKMSDEERRKYKSMEEQGKIQIKNYVRNNMLLKKYILVLEIMLRLRQMCCHSFLLPDNSDCMPSEESDSEEEDFEKKRETLVNRLKVISESEEECSVCVDVLKTPVILPCAHYFCHTCILNAIKHMEQAEKGSATCPLCRAPISEDQIIDLPKEPEPQIYGDWKSSTKVDALMSALVKMRSADPSEKSLVVSQFTSFLTVLETPLRELKFRFVRLDGKMSALQRTEAVKKFSDPEPGSPTIFLISLRAGGVGLNLTAASKVFLMEPHWNPATEEQCFDRCHRLGQTKDVIITKFISEDTIEDRMLDLQERKRMLMQQSFKKKQTATERNEQRTRDIRNLMNIL